MSNSDSYEDNYFDEAENALSKNREQSSNKEEEKKKIRPAYLLGGITLILVIVLAVQFLFSGEAEITEPIIPPVVIQQFNGQLSAFSQMVDGYKMINGILPETEQEFLGYDDPVITYTRTGDDSYTLEYTFGDSSLVLESTIDTEIGISPPQLPGNPPVSPPEGIPTPPQ
ncbi:MAG: hypothetical protein K8R76_03055 [Candidatus Aegiribacteria sp.]|nr:hypothetical protein [Candidatus Aegiribacteria sp.]